MKCWLKRVDFSSVYVILKNITNIRHWVRFVTQPKKIFFICVYVCFLDFKLLFIFGSDLWRDKSQVTKTGHRGKKISKKNLIQNLWSACFWQTLGQNFFSCCPQGALRISDFILTWDFHWYWPVSCQNIHKRWLPSSWRSHNCNEFSTAELPWNSFQKGLITWKKKEKFTEPLITSGEQWKFISTGYWWEADINSLRGWCQHQHAVISKITIKITIKSQIVSGSSSSCHDTNGITGSHALASLQDGF